MQNRYRDFDAFYAEKERVPVTLKIFGKKHQLPPALPAGIVLRLMRMQKNYGEMSTVPHAELIEMALEIFGEGRVEEWVQSGLDVEQLGELIKWVMGVYMGAAQEEVKEKNEQSPQGQDE